MGTTSEWLRVLELGVFWGLGVFLWEAIAGRKSLASVANLLRLTVTGLLFGMFLVFEWRVIHGGIAIVFLLAVVGLLFIGLAERRSLSHVGVSAQTDAAVVHNVALANLAEAQKLSRTGSFDWNVLSGEITWSDETFRIFEYPPSLTPTLELVMARIHPADRALVQQTIDRASTERPHFDVEHRLLMPDGTVKYLHVVARAVETSSVHLRFAGAITDITDRKRAEEALRRSEGYFAEAQRLTGVAVGPGTYVPALSSGRWRFFAFTALTRRKRILPGQTFSQGFIPKIIQGSSRERKWSPHRSTGKFPKPIFASSFLEG